MMTKNNDNNDLQRDLFKTLLLDIIGHNHPLIKLADSIDWDSFDESLADSFDCSNGRPSIPVRVIVGLHFLKYSYDLSDNDLLFAWLENPYWQYFPGGIYFEHSLPTDEVECIGKGKVHKRYEFGG